MLSQRHTAVSILMVAPRGGIAEALRSVLQSIPEVDIINIVTTWRPAAQAIQNEAPDLMIVSDQIPADEILALLESLAAKREAPRVIVLATSLTQRQRFLDAGAFGVVLRGEPVEQLRASIRRSLVR